MPFPPQTSACNEERAWEVVRPALAAGAARPPTAFRVLLALGLHFEDRPTVKPVIFPARRVSWPHRRRRAMRIRHLVIKLKTRMAENRLKADNLNREFLEYWYTHYDS
jgi:hypothetical protein